MEPAVLSALRRTAGGCTCAAAQNADTLVVVTAQLVRVLLALFPRWLPCRVGEEAVTGAYLACEGQVLFYKLDLYTLSREVSGDPHAKKQRKAVGRYSVGFQVSYDG